MRFSIALFIVVFTISLNVRSQQNYAGKYRQSWLSYTCYLELNPDSTFVKHCKRHMWNPLDEKGKWRLNKDTMILATDTSIEKLLVDDHLLNSHYSKDSIDGATESYLPNYYVSLETYHKDKTIAIIKSWNEKSRWNPIPHGEWKYFDNKGRLVQIEIYKKGKLKRMEIY